MGENIRNVNLAVGTTVVEVSPQLQERQRNVLCIVNTSTAAQVITLSWGASASAGAGVVLYVGGSWSESVDSSFFPSNERITAVSSAAAGSIGIHERIKV